MGEEWKGSVAEAAVEVDVQKAVVHALLFGWKLLPVAVLLAEESLVVAHAHQFESLEHDWGAVAIPFAAVEVCAVHHRVAAYGITFVEGGGGVVGVDHLGHLAARVELAQQQRPPAPGAVSVFVRVAVDEVAEHAQAAEAAVEAFAQLRVGRYAVDGKHVDEDAALEGARRSFHDGGARVFYLGVVEGVVGVLEVGAQAVVGRQPFVGVAQKLLVVGAWHRDVDVVVPGYEASVAHGSEQRASFEDIAEAVGADGAVGFLQNGEEMTLHLLYVVAHWLIVFRGRH